MRGRRFDRLFDRFLATSAIALALAAAGGLPATAAMGDRDSISAAVPLPEAANVPPPTAADVGALPAAGVAPGAAPLTEQEIEARVPLPEAADVPPPSLADVGGPAVTGAISTRDAKPEAAAAAAPVVAPQPAIAPAPAATPAPAAQDIAAQPPAAAPVEENPIVVAMRELTGVKLARLIERKNERAAIEAFYARRAFAPMWIEDGEASARAKAAIAYLATVDTEGLDPAEYHTPVFRAGAEPAALAEAEIKMTNAILTYARHAQSGRVHWTRISADIHYSHTAPEPAQTLAKIADAKNLGETLAAFNPPHAGYKALKAKLAEIRGQKADGGPTPIPGGPVLKLGMHDNRVPLVRERLGATGDPRDTTFDKDVAEAVRKFQQERKLKATGTLTAATIDAINGPRRSSARDADIILANMERWRWLPRELGNASRAHVMLNIPDFTLRVSHNNAVVWQTRVVVGKPHTPTPILTETMKYITVNPTWNVPPSIVYNEYLPALQQDPTVLERMGLKLSQNRDGSVHISQPPGERNALGRIRFNFPNRFLVYQHDTPDKSLFAHDKRAYSHGCMRVQDPARYAEVLLSIARPTDGYTQDRIRKMFGNSEIDIQLPNHIPVHITYQTAYVDDHGKLVIRDDVYGRDSRVIAALKTEDRRVADLAIDRPKPSYARPAVRLPNGVGQSYASNNGPSFFEMLFGGGQQAQPAPPANARNARRTFAR
jgi:murein L,D-transpeptidase YcbB/YkuD